jgi:flagellar hook-associated protein 1 FlgK
VISSTDASLGVAVAGGDVGGSEQSVSDYFGLNDLLTGNSASTIAVRGDILSGSTAFATATLDTGSTLAAGDQALTSSSSFVSSIESALEANQSFSASGGLAATTTTLAGYAADIVSSAATTASQASSRLDTVQSDYDSFSDAMSSATGVNVDEETSKMSDLEQQYSVSAQLLEALNAMFQALLDAAKAS